MVGMKVFELKIGKSRAIRPAYEGIETSDQEQDLPLRVAPLSRDPPRL